MILVPMLDCPECGVALVPAHGRGHYTREGELQKHKNPCFCPWCDWFWEETWLPEDLVECVCGAKCHVRVDEDRAYLSVMIRESRS